jgi:hypothetical protein
MPKVLKTIELKPPIKFEELNVPQKITTWIVKIGRVVIIATELLAFSVFVARIKLDRDLTDLSDQLENQLAVLQNAQSLEGTVRDYQTRISLIKELRENQTSAAKMITFFVERIPAPIILTGLSLDTQGGFDLSAKTNSAPDFAQMVAVFKGEKVVQDIAMVAGRFDSKQGFYHFTLNIKLSDDWL